MDMDIDMAMAMAIDIDIDIDNRYKIWEMGISTWIMDWTWI
jgi:hypothetical protein